MPEGCAQSEPALPGVGKETKQTGRDQSATRKQGSSNLHVPIETALTRSCPEMGGDNLTAVLALVVLVATMIVPLVLLFRQQKTAYEIASCLVGSEMCIRDRYKKADYAHALSRSDTDVQMYLSKPSAGGATRSNGCSTR